MKIDTVHLSAKHRRLCGNFFTSIDISGGDKGIKLDKFEISQELALKIFNLVEEEVRPQLEERLKALSSMKLESANSVIEMKAEVVPDSE